MRKLLTFIAAVAGLLLAASCTETKSEIAVSPAELSFAATIDSKTITVTSNSSWSASATESWVRLGAASGSGDTSLTLTVEENPTTQERSASVTFRTEDGAATANINVLQKAAAAVFSLSSTEASVAAEGGSFTVKVTYNIAYKITSKPDWVEQSDKTTSGNVDTYTFTAAANTDSQAREGVIVFCNDNDECVPVTVKQASAAGGDGSGDEKDPEGGDGEEGYEDGSWTEKEFYHKSLGMRFTATWCGYCYMMANSFEKAMSEYPDKLELVNLHGNSSDLFFSGTTTLANIFYITGYPTAIIDYRSEINNYDTDYTASLIVNSIKETEANYPVTSGITFNSSISGRKVNVDVKLYLKEKGDYKVGVFMIEDGIIGYQASKGNNYQHDRIARSSLTSIEGEEFSVSEDNMTYSKQYSATIASGWKKDNLSILVYVLKQYGSQKIISTQDYSKYYVDNAVSAPVGTSQKLVFTEGSTSGTNEDTSTGGDIKLD